MRVHSTLVEVAGLLQLRMIHATARETGPCSAAVSSTAAVNMLKSARH